MPSIKGCPGEVGDRAAEGGKGVTDQTLEQDIVGWVSLAAVTLKKQVGQK